MSKNFPVVYLWADADGEYQGNTVCSGADEAHALARFLKRNPHIKDAWIAGSRSKVVEEVAA